MTETWFLLKYPHLKDDLYERAGIMEYDGGLGRHMATMGAIKILEERENELSGSNGLHDKV